MRTSILRNQEAVTQAAKSSTSISEALYKLNLRPAGGNFEAFKKACRNFNIDYPRFDRAAQLSEIRNITPLEEILTKNSTYKGNRQALLKRLQKARLLENNCRLCGLKPTWNNKPLTLQLDHINGDGDDNRLTNLQPVCPNCHSQTDTFCGKKQPKRCKCGLVMSKNSVNCITCSNQITNKKREKIEWPDVGELLKRLENSNYSALARELGVSDNAIRKRIKNHS